MRNLVYPKFLIPSFNRLNLTAIVTKSCGGKFGAPSPSPESSILKINADSDKVPSPLSLLKIWMICTELTSK